MKTVSSDGNSPKVLPVPALRATGVNDANVRSLALCSNSAARNLIPYNISSRLNALPLSVVFNEREESSVLIALFGKPPSVQVVQELEFAAGMEVFPEYADPAMLSLAIDAAYLGAAERLSAASFVFNNSADDQADVPGFVDCLLNRAVALGVSDIHLEPFTSGYRTRFRIDGLLKVVNEAALEGGWAERIIRRVKVMCNLDLTENRRPQDGGFTFVCGARQIRMRVSAFPQHRGEKLVIRLLDDQCVTEISESTKSSPFAQLGMPADQAQYLLNYLACDRGTLLLAGPTGSGKSTLLYAALTHLNKEWRNISTLEDPVERVIPGISQVQVHREHGLDFPELLPALLRQDPDVIMLGEIRDARTAEVALTAGLTGHLVLSTVHAANGFEVIARLRQLGLDSALIADSLKLVISQRLVTRNCMNCLEVRHVGAGFRTLFGLKEEQEFYAGKGCVHCAQSGTDGRYGIFEFMPVDQTLRAAIADANVSHQALRDAASATVHFSCPNILRESLERGIISPDAALRAVGLAPDLAQFGLSVAMPFED